MGICLWVYTSMENYSFKTAVNTVYTGNKGPVYTGNIVALYVLPLQTLSRNKILLLQQFLARITYFTLTVMINDIHEPNWGASWNCTSPNKL